MIAHLSGTLLYKDLKHIIIDVQGVGYKVFATTDDISSLTLGEPVIMWIHTTVREDALDLYGFIKRQTQDFFQLLTTVSGIGPKSAMGILSAASIDTIREAVITGETSYLTKISGIGKKVAEKIIIELRGKVDDDGTGTGDISGLKNKNDIDTLEALKSLGYSHKEAREALEKIPAGLTDPGEKVKAALKNLG